MDGFSCEVDITNNIPEMMKNFDIQKEKALILCGMQAEGYAKIELESSPRRVDTGRLRNSITYATQKEKSSPSFDGGDDGDLVDPDSGVDTSQCPDDSTVIIGTNVEYAYEIHEGDATRKLAPNRFLRNAIEKHQDEYKQIIDETMREE